MMLAIFALGLGLADGFSASIWWIGYSSNLSPLSSQQHLIKDVAEHQHD
jgi:hypothetical protein